MNDNAPFSAGSAATPAADFVTALDQPLGWVRQKFGAYAPVFAICVLMQTLPNLPTQFFAAKMQAEQMEDPLAGLKWLPFLYIGPCVSIFGMAIGSSIQGAVVANLLDGKGAGLGEAWARIARLNYWLGALVFGLIVGLGWMMCCFGGFFLLVPFGLAAAILVTDNVGVDAIPRSSQLSLMKTGSGLFDRPGWKVLGCTLASATVVFTLMQVVAIPTWVSMGTKMYDAFKSGNPQAIQEAAQVDPWITAASLLVQSVVRVVTDGYGIVAIQLIYRDAKARFGGDDLEKAIANG